MESLPSVSDLDPDPHLDPLKEMSPGSGSASQMRIQIQEVRKPRIRIHMDIFGILDPDLKHCLYLPVSYRTQPLS